MTAPNNPQDNPFRHTDPDVIGEDMGLGDMWVHGDPGNWTPVGNPRQIPANARGAAVGDLKVIETWSNEFGQLIEYHYFRYADGTRSVGKIQPYSP
jgi:hypothetical protein